MRGNEELLARFASLSSTINTGAPKPVCTLCRFCVANDVSFYPEVDLITQSEFEAQLQAIEAQPFSIPRDGWDGSSLMHPAIWFSYKEPFIHPRLIDFVEATSRRIPHRRIVVVSVGFQIQPSQVERLNALPNVQLGISLATFNPEIRAVLYGHSNTKNIEWVIGHSENLGVMFTDVGSTDQVERDIDRYLTERKGKLTWLGVRRLDHTRFAPPEIAALSAKGVANLNATIARVLDRINMYSTTDLESIIQFGAEKSELPELFDWLKKDRASIDSIIATHGPGRYVVCTALSAEKYWRTELADYGDSVEVVGVKNYTLGGSMDCAGLLSVADVKAAVGEPLDRIVILPRAMFGAFGHDIQRVSIEQLPSCYVVADSSFDP